MAIDTASPTKNPNTKKPLPSSPNNAAAKRTKNPGIRIIGGRIYDSENGKTCHQCRQKTRDFAAACKGIRRDKSCTIKFCHKCLLNRYGEKAEEVAELEGWNCPKCRGVCNCSFCMKKKGQRPTGMLVHTAKATGYSSVFELLHKKGSEGVGTENVIEDGSVTRKKSHRKENQQNGVEPLELVVATKKTLKKSSKKLKGQRGNVDPPEFIRSDKQEKENIQGDVSTEKRVLPESKKRRGSIVVDYDNGKQRQPKVRKLKQQAIDKEDNSKESLPDNMADLDSIKKEESLDNHEKKSSVNVNVCDAKAKTLPKACKSRKPDIGRPSEPKREYVVLPQGTPLMMVGGVQFLENDVGEALQFLEFCNAFSEILRIKQGHAEIVLQEVTQTHTRRQKIFSVTVEFHIKLIAIIQEDMGEKPLSCSSKNVESWLPVLGKYIQLSQCASKELPLDCLIDGSAGYDDLDTSMKLKLLNFLCDETLYTKKLRDWIYTENKKFLKMSKEVNEKVLAAKKREKEFKQKLKDDVAKSMLSSNDGATLTVSEHDMLISKIKIASEKAHAEKLESINLLPKLKRSSSAMRTDPELLEGSGHAYWKLRGYSSSSKILLQDIENWDSTELQEKWFMYDDEEEELIQKLISPIRLRLRRVILHNKHEENPLEAREDQVKQISIEKSTSPSHTD